MNFDSALAKLRLSVERGVTWSSSRVPIRLGLGLADSIGLVAALLPRPAGRIARREIYACTGATGARNFWLAGKRLAQRRRELVYLSRIAGGQNLSDMGVKVVEYGSEHVQGLRDSGRSFIIASLHFSTSATLAAYLRGCWYEDTVAISKGVWPEDTTVEDRRLQMIQELQIDALRGAAKSRLSKPDSEELGRMFHYVAREEEPKSGLIKGLLGLVQELKEKGRCCFIAVDAPFRSRHSLERPFAGLSSRSFSLGVMHVARAAKCPVVPCAPVWRLGGMTAEVHWGEPIELGADITDVAAQNRLLDWLEACVARFPCEYTFPVGFDRYWRNGRWSNASAIEGA